MKNQAQLSPKKYIVCKARTLPIYKCLISENWEASKLASIVVMRKHANGNVTAGIYLVDLLALGTKDTFFEFSINENEFLEKVSANNLIEVDYTLVHNIIYGANAFAIEHGFRLHRDFLSITQFILEEDTEEIPLMELEFGQEGKPFLIQTM
jgi:hypothetical protein